jgi:hypothetical protein
MFAYLNILFLVYSIFINCDLQIFRKTLVKMFLDQDEDIVFMETSMKLKYYPHVHIECVPLPRETGDMAPIYFKVGIISNAIIVYFIIFFFMQKMSSLIAIVYRMTVLYSVSKL